MAISTTHLRIVFLSISFSSLTTSPSASALSKFFNQAELVNPDRVPQVAKNWLMLLANRFAEGHFSYSRQKIDELQDDDRNKLLARLGLPAGTKLDHHYLLKHYTRPQEVVDEIYDLLEGLHRVFKDQRIEYTMIGGTYLGAIRHGGFIHWDDDGDLAILEEGFRKLSSKKVKEALKKEGIALRWSLFGFQAYRWTKGESSRSYYYRNNPVHGYEKPFIDLFVLKKRPTGGYEYATLASDILFQGSTTKNFRENMGKGSKRLSYFRWAMKRGQHSEIKEVLSQD